MSFPSFKERCPTYSRCTVCLFKKSFVHITASSCNPLKPALLRHKIDNSSLIAQKPAPLKKIRKKRQIIRKTDWGNHPLFISLKVMIMGQWTICFKWKGSICISKPFEVQKEQGFTECLGGGRKGRMILLKTQDV